MDDSMPNELGALRARAYGPAADLHDDPAALDRLRELEDIARGSTAHPVDSAPPPYAEDAASEVASDAQPAASDDLVPAADEIAFGQAGSADGSRHRLWGTKRAVIVLVACVATAVIVTATATSVISRRVQADPREVAVLGVDPVATAPPIFGSWECDGVECWSTDGFDSTVFDSFHGVSLFTIPGASMGQGDGDVCLVLMRSSEMSVTPESSFSGPIYTGCSAGEFPPVLQVTVSSQFPDEFRERFPDGSGMRFTLDGEELIVVSDRAA